MKKILFLLLCLCTAAIQADVYNVKDYGAKADGKTIDSPAINRAIQEAAANGGGTVYLPAGNYACYSIRLASHVHLLMEQGTVITAAFPSATEPSLPLPMAMTKRKPTNTTATRISATATGRTRSSGASDWKTSPSAARD